MPKLPVLSPEEVAKILGKKGYKLDRIRGSHHIYYHEEEKKIAVVPFHKRELPKGTLLSILKHAGISREELEELRKK